MQEITTCPRTAPRRNFGCIRATTLFAVLGAIAGCGDTAAPSPAGSLAATPTPTPTPAPTPAATTTASTTTAASPAIRVGPVELPATIEAENFDRGGEGVGYHDITAANVGGLYRPGEGVDIIAAPDNGNFVVNNFETGEWLAYTVDVPAAANYELTLYAASAFDRSAYHIEVDGIDTTGPIEFQNTGGWSSFQWSIPWIIGLPTGRHVLKIVADNQYFDLDSFRVRFPPENLSLSSAEPPPSLPLPDTSAVAFACSFVGSASDCGLDEQSEAPGRSSKTRVARDGKTAIRLHTEPGDKNVAASGEMERDDLWLSQEATDGYEGREAWWGHSIFFPDDFTVPTWQSYVVFDFHNSGAGPWQANFHVAFEHQSDTSRPGLLSLFGYGGVNSGDGRFHAELGEVQKNIWYDFVYHVRWSSGADGFFDAWVNGKRVLAHQGPTLYSGQGVYLKLANYHNPICDPYPACIGKHKGSSVIHDRVIRASTPEAVASGPLEGVLDLVDGALKRVSP